MRVVRKTFALEVLMGGQQQTLDSALQELGLSQNEIALYRTALNLGPRPASTLAKTIKVQRTRVYDLLSSLEARGLVEMIERNCVRHYAATPPQNLLSLVRDRKKYVDNQLQLLEQAIPSLFEKTEHQSTTIESKSVRGTRLVREALDDLFSIKNSSVLAIGDLEQILRSNLGTSRWAQTLRKRRIENDVWLRICVQGPPDLVVERALLRETLSSPDIPKHALGLVTNDFVLFIEQGSTIQATRIESKPFCLILNGLYNSWLHAVQRIA